MLVAWPLSAATPAVGSEAPIASAIACVSASVRCASAAGATGTGTVAGTDAGARLVPAPSALGRVYNYDFGSAKLTYRVPPAGFDPLRATAAELALYGLPERPAGAALSSWRHDMADLHFVAAPRYLRAVEAHAASSLPDYSDHWAGYVAYGGRYLTTASTWLEPVVHPGKCRSSSLTIWAGIGGYASAALAQDGTAVGTPGIGQHQAWWELTPAGMVPVPLYASVGKRFTAEVHYLGDERFSFFMENDATGATWAAVEKSPNGATLATAEAIVERPCLAHCTQPGSTYANLTNFGRVTFLSAQADGRPLQSYSNYAESMSALGVPYGRELAFPGPSRPGSSGFVVTHNSCS